MDVNTIRQGVADAETLIPPRLTVIDVTAFLALVIPPREMLLAPVLPAQGLAMLYAQRGIGKTHVALGIAYAVASGGVFPALRMIRCRA